MIPGDLSTPQLSHYINNIKLLTAAYKYDHQENIRKENMRMIWNNIMILNNQRENYFVQFKNYNYIKYQ